LNLEQHYEDSTLRMASCRNAYFVVWSDAPTGEQMRTFDRGGHEFDAKHPGGTVCFNIIVGGRPKFTADVREAAAEMSARDDIYRLGTAHVVLVDGMKGAATRAFLGTIVLLTRPKMTRVFGELAAACEFLGEGLTRSGVKWTRAELLEAAQAAVNPPGRPRSG
jgi:hypothetical protein